MLGADKKLGTVLELGFRALVVWLPGSVSLTVFERSDQAFNTAGELMISVKNVEVTSGLLVDIDAPDKAPTIFLPETGEGTQALRNPVRQFEAFFVDRLVIRYEAPAGLSNSRKLRTSMSPEDRPPSARNGLFSALNFLDRTKPR